MAERRLADDDSPDPGFLAYLAQRGLRGILAGINVAAGVESHCPTLL
jgi:hypothetical protein